MSSSSVIRVGRRHFLAGVGGFALAVPFLGSLEKRARASAPAVQPRYFYFGTDHGGCWDSSFFPQVTTTQTTTAGPPSNTATLTVFGCNVTGDSLASVIDVQFMINEALGIGAPLNDLNHDFVVNVVDVQIVIDAALGLSCSVR